MVQPSSPRLVSLCGVSPEITASSPRPAAAGPHTQVQPVPGAAGAQQSPSVADRTMWRRRCQRRRSQLLRSTAPRAPLNALTPIISNYTRCIRSQTALNLEEDWCRFQVQSSELPQPHEKLIFLGLLKKCLLMI